MEYKVHVKNVHYMDNDNNVKNYYVGQDERLSKAKAQEIFKEKGIEYKKIFTVISETIKVDIPQEILKEKEVK